MTDSVKNCGPCLGFKSNEFVAYFSSGEIAVEEGCDLLRPIDEEYIGDDGEIFYVRVTVDTYFDDSFEFVELTHSHEENLQKFQQLVSRRSLEEITDGYIESLPDEQKYDIGETFNPEDVIMSIELMNCISYPDEY